MVYTIIERAGKIRNRIFILEPEETGWKASLKRRLLWERYCSFDCFIIDPTVSRRLCKTYGRRPGIHSGREE